MTDGTSSEPTDRPDWWRKNQRLREEMGLPEYDPPRFEDGVYTHDVVPELESEHDCTVAFRSKRPRHPCEWEILVDGERVATTDRRRTDRGNTVYQLSSSAFREAVASALDST